MRSEYALINSEFNAFLFASVGEEANGVELSVLSALTRLGLDPWAEAARLSGLTKPKAVQALSGILDRFSELPPAADIAAVSGRLANLLPKPSGQIVGKHLVAPGKLPQVGFWVICLLSLVALSVTWLLNLQQ